MADPWPWEDKPAKGQQPWPWEDTQAATPPAPPSAISRFLSSAGAALNPIPAIQEYLARPSQMRLAGEAMAAGMRARRERRKPTPEEAAIIERGMQANIGAGQALPLATGPPVTAAVQALQGNIAGGAGTLAGAYGVPLAVGYGLTRPAVQKGMAAGATATRGALGEVVRSTPRILGGAVEGAIYGSPFGLGGMKTGATLGGMRQVRKAAIRGVGQALQARREAEIAAAARARAEAARPQPIPAARQLPPGDIVTPPAEDTSFVRAVPGEYAVPEAVPPERRLAAPPTVIIPEAPPDTSFVRAVPGEYPPVERPLPEEPGARTAAEANEILGRELSVPQKTETPPAPTASEHRVQGLAEDLIEQQYPTEHLGMLKTDPDLRLSLERRAKQLDLGAPAPGEIKLIIEEVQRLRGEEPAAETKPKKTSLLHQTIRPGMTPAEARAAFEAAKTQRAYA